MRLDQGLFGVLHQADPRLCIEQLLNKMDFLKNGNSLDSGSQCYFFFTEEPSGGKNGVSGKLLQT